MKYIQKTLAILSRCKHLFKILPVVDSLKLVLFSYVYSEEKEILVSPRKLNFPILIRNNRIDERTLLGTFNLKYHLPPPEIQLSDKPTILDLGANIGSTCCHYASLYPNASIIGYELDKDNAILALTNITPYENIEIKQQGVWSKNITSTYSIKNKTNAYRVEDLDPKNEDVITVQLVAINEIVKSYGVVDFLKMDIEGAEIDILSNSNHSWLDNLQSFNIEFHLNKNQSLIYYEKFFEKKGFTISRNNRHFSSIIGYRNLNQIEV